jgi:hypothetical protein
MTIQRSTRFIKFVLRSALVSKAGILFTKLVLRSALFTKAGTLFAELVLRNALVTKLVLRQYKGAHSLLSLY